MIGSWGLLSEANKGPQRILTYGESGAGKSYRTCQAMEAILTVDETCRIFLTDTDGEYPKTLTHFPEVVELLGKRVLYSRTRDWKTLHQQTVDFVKYVKPGDWYILDKASIFWALAPDYFMRRDAGRSVEDVEKAYAATGKAGNALRDFYAPIINPGWMKWEEMILTSGAHIMFVCDEKDVVKDGDKRPYKDDHETQVAFERVGARPAIQKDCWPKFDSILYIAQPWKGKFRITTLRERENVQDYDKATVEHFGFDYLVGNLGYPG